MPKFIPKVVLKKDYGLEKAASVRNAASCFATNAQWVKVTELENDYIIIVKPEDSDTLSISTVSEKELMETDYICFDGSDTDIFITRHFSFEENVQQAITFLDPSIQKAFSKWLFDLDNDTYTTICDRKDYMPTANIVVSLSIEDYGRFVNAEDIVTRSADLHIQGMYVPRVGKSTTFKEPFNGVTDFIFGLSQVTDDVKAVTNAVSNSESGDRSYEIMSIEELNYKVNEEINENESPLVEFYTFDTRTESASIDDELLTKLINFYDELDEEDKKILDIKIILDYSVE